jgi:16S rRNA processing protein RimM
VSLTGVGDRDSAERLRGCLMYVPASEAAPLGEDEYWIHDLIGMSVVSEQGEKLGVVTDYISRPAQDLLIVEDETTREFEMPFVREFVRKIDREASAITVRVIEGLVPRD